jgi:hypothetical protein
MDHFVYESYTGSSFSSALQNAQDNLSQYQHNSMTKDIMIASVICNVIVILQGLAVVYSIVR